jgi:tripartite-type tricarboxylate transporter receptor subunit TctC
VLATSGEKRSPLMPDLPNFAEAGYKDVVATAWFAYYAPRRTPPPIVEQLRAQLLRAANSREVRQQLLAGGMYPVADDHAALLKTMQADTARWRTIMKAVNFQATD